MFDAGYSPGCTNKLSRQVKLEIEKHNKKESESRLQAAADVMQGTRPFFRDEIWPTKLSDSITYQKPACTSLSLAISATTEASWDNR